MSDDSSWKGSESVGEAEKQRQQREVRRECGKDYGNICKRTSRQFLLEINYIPHQFTIDWNDGNGTKIVNISDLHGD
jgi:hypothetical protein